MSREKWQSPGTGSVYEFEGRWYARMATGGMTKGGKPAYRKVGCNTRTEAVEALRRMTVEKDVTGWLVANVPAPLGPFLDRWLAETIQPNKQFKTHRTYEQHVRLYIKPRLGNVSIPDLTADHVQAWVKWMQTEGKQLADGKRSGLAVKTILDARGVLDSALKKASARGLIKVDPLVGVEWPGAEKRKAIYLPADSAIALIEASENHAIGPMIELALLTGLRLGEITGLTWEDVDMPGATLHVRRQLQFQNGKPVLKRPKTEASTRDLHLPEPAVSVLREQQSRQRLAAMTTKSAKTFNPLKLVFTTAAGAPLPGPDVDDMLKALCKKAEIPAVSFHKLRHTAASHMAAKGVPLSVVKDQLGHAQLSTVNVYTHPVPAALKDGAHHLSTVYKRNNP